MQSRQAYAAFANYVPAPGSTAHLDAAQPDLVVPSLGFELVEFNVISDSLSSLAGTIQGTFDDDPVNPASNWFNLVGMLTNGGWYPSGITITPSANVPFIAVPAGCQFVRFRRTAGSGKVTACATKGGLLAAIQMADSETFNRLGTTENIAVSNTILRAYATTSRIEAPKGSQLTNHSTTLYLYYKVIALATALGTVVSATNADGHIAPRGSAFVKHGQNQDIAIVRDAVSTDKYTALEVG
jgi:hypothetical protein